MCPNCSQNYAAQACPTTALVQPRVDLAAGTLTISAPSASEPLVLPLTQQSGAHIAAARDSTTAAAHPTLPQQFGLASTAAAAAKAPVADISTTIRVCGDSVCGSVVVGPHADVPVMRAWFQCVLGFPCVLVRQLGGQRAARPGTGGTGRRTPAAKVAGAIPGSGMSTTNTTSTTSSNNATGFSHESAPRPALHANHANVFTESNASGGASAEANREVVLCTSPPAASIGFANDGQYLLVNAASVDDVNARIAAAAPSTTPAAPVELLRCAQRVCFCTGLH
jgi:hypothetical protein